MAEPEWLSGIQRCARSTDGHGCEPQPEPPPLQVCGSKRLSCHADLSKCHTRCESEDHMSKKACKKGSTLAMKPSTDITRRPKQGYQWPHEKDLCPPIIFKKNKKKPFLLVFIIYVFLSEKFSEWEFEQKIII